MIKIIFKTARPRIDVTLDNCAVPYSFESDYVISFDVDAGFHQLKITARTDERITIEKVLVNDCDCRKLLYLSWATNSNQHKFQPCTELWEQNMSWILPFVLPLSNWIVLAEKKFKNTEFGKNLFQNYICYYPESNQLDNSMPGVIKDFYQCNFVKK